MIPEHMLLKSKKDVEQWVHEFEILDENGVLDKNQIKNLSQWIWEYKPFIGCTYEEHPISKVDGEMFWMICDGNYNDGNYKQVECDLEKKKDTNPDKLIMVPWKILRIISLQMELKDPGSLELKALRKCIDEAPEISPSIAKLIK